MFVKEDCNCTRRATHYRCRFCDTREYGGAREMRRLNANRAQCEHPDAPEPSSEERFKGFLGGTFDCLDESERG